MIDLVSSIDTSIFFFINHSLQNSVFDILMPWITDLNKHIPVVIAVFAALVWMIVRGDTSTRWAAILLVLTIVVSDQLNSVWLKHMFERARPCRTLADVHLLVSCGSGYSFPSSHAVNTFAGATVLAYFFRKQTWVFMAFAATVAFSRVYVGVHYPSDVLGGGMLGVALGMGACYLYSAGADRFRTRKAMKDELHDSADSKS